MDKVKITVIGAGTMGAGIAQRASQSGFSVAMLDVKDEFVQNGFATIEKTLAKGIELGKVTPEQKKQIIKNIKGTTDIEEAVGDTSLVIEAVFEDMQVKKDLFGKLDSVCGENVIFASNTSSLSITDMGKGTSRQENFAGLHFFYPPAINRLVEVIAGESTSYETVDWLIEFSQAMGKIPIRVKDAPGFAVNRFFVPWLNEATRMLEDGTADIPTIDAAAMEAFEIGMGPFKLMNVTGIPIAYHSQDSLYRGLGEFYRPSDKLREQFESGELWNLEGNVDGEAKKAVKRRFLGVEFGVACQLVQEGVASKEDTDRGAVVGLRWAKGPFAMMNSYGIEESHDMVKAVARGSKGTFEVPDILEEQTATGLPWDLKTLRISREGRIAVITFTRPEAMNALNSKVLSDLGGAAEELEDDDEVLAVIITGEGKAFVAGADIREMMVKDPMAAREFTYLGQSVLRRIETLGKPVIAAVNGVALGGGCELALACDMIIASEKARLGFPEVGLGIHPGFGGTQRLPRLVGRARAKELIFTADILDAEQAQRMGLVNRVVDSHELMKVAMGIASKIATKAPIAVRLAKSAINRGSEMDLETGLAYEVESVSVTFATEDSKEGMRAFTERRKPNFQGR